MITTIVSSIRRYVLAICLLACATSVFAATGTLFPSPWFTALDTNGNPISFAKACFYTAGTSTLATTYSDVSLTTPNQNPVRANISGRVGPVYLTPGQSYKLILQDSTGTTGVCDGAVVQTQDNIAAVPTSAASVDVNGTAGEAITAGQCLYLSAGDAGKTPGQWYKCDAATAYSITTNAVGLATTNITSGSTGTIRLSGQVTGLSSLSPGSTYYVGSGGAITTTLSARKIGEADSATTIIVSGNPPPTTTLIRGCDVRLTLTSGTPITTSDVTGAVTVFVTPYAGSGGPAVCSLYDGAANWLPLAVTEVSVALGTLTTALPHDIFCFNNSGVFACDAPVAWANASTRTTGLVVQNGVYVKSGATTRRYIGTFYTTSTTTTEDSLAKRDVYNYYNRVPRLLQVTDATNFAYTTATYQQYRAQAANQIEVITGVVEEPITVWASGFATNTTGAGIDVSIGEDSTTTPATGAQSGAISLSTLAAPAYTKVSATLDKVPTVGWHRYVWLQESQAAGTTNWRGNDTVPYVLAGIFGRVRQ